jgi:hypothetical protein
MEKRKPSIALQFALIVYVSAVAYVWIYCSTKSGVPLALPEKVLYIGMVLVGAVTGESTLINRQPKKE